MPEELLELEVEDEELLEPELELVEDVELDDVLEWEDPVPLDEETFPAELVECEEPADDEALELWVEPPEVEVEVEALEVLAVAEVEVEVVEVSPEQAASARASEITSHERVIGTSAVENLGREADVALLSAAIMPREVGVRHQVG